MYGRSILWITTLDAAYGMPPFVQQVFGVLGLMAGDTSFAQPECSGMASFASQFTLNLAGVSFIVFACFVAVCLMLLYGVVMGGTCVLLLLSFVVSYRLRLRRALATCTTDDEREEARVAEKFRFIAKCSRGLFVVFAFVYEVTCVEALRAVHCIYDQGQLLLAADKQQVRIPQPSQRDPSFAESVVIVSI